MHLNFPWSVERLRKKSCTRVSSVLPGPPTPALGFQKCRIVDPRDLMEDTFLVHSALGHQVMEMGVISNGLFPSFLPDCIGF